MGGAAAPILGPAAVLYAKDREKRKEEQAKKDARAASVQRAAESKEQRRRASDAQTFEARQRAEEAAASAPGSPTSILTGEADPLGTKRKKLLGF